MNIFRKIQQIRNDHRAMDIVRKGNGDIELIAVATTCGTIYQCKAWQYDELKMEDRDPAMAIIKSTVTIDYVMKLGLNI